MFNVSTVINSFYCILIYKKALRKRSIAVQNTLNRRFLCISTVSHTCQQRCISSFQKTTARSHPLNNASGLNWKDLAISIFFWVFRHLLAFWCFDGVQCQLDDGKLLLSPSIHWFPCTQCRLNTHCVSTKPQNTQWDSFPYPFSLRLLSLLQSGLPPLQLLLLPSNHPLTWVCVCVCVACVCLSGPFLLCNCRLCVYRLIGVALRGDSKDVANPPTEYSGSSSQRRLNSTPRTGSTQIRKALTRPCGILGIVEKLPTGLFWERKKKAFGALMWRNSRGTVTINRGSPDADAWCDVKKIQKRKRANWTFPSTKRREIFFF